MSNESESVVIVEYGMGNVRSVQSAFELLGCRAKISDDARAIREADALVLPGVGAFGRAMDNLRQRDLIGPLNDAVLARKTPILGICLGMQLFADSSEEMGHHVGLGWIPGRVRLIEATAHGLALPHVGWNNVYFDESSRLLARVPSGTHFYFDHSYEYTCDVRYTIATVEYGAKIVAAVARDEILGVQFHPEKSQTSGLKLLRNFLNIVSRKPETRAGPEGATC